MGDSNSGQKPKPKKARSSSYPAMSLEKSINGIRLIKDNLGNGPFDRLTAAKALNYASMSGSASQAVAALVHFGLLTRRGDVYQVSTLAEDILTYRDDSERMSAIIRSAQHPKLFSDLISRFGGRSLPAMLDNILVRDHGINERVAGEVKKIFVDSMSYAGYLENGVLKTADFEPKHSSEPNAERGVDEPADEQLPPKKANPGVLPSNVIPITGGFAVAYPADVALLDLMVNQNFVAAITALKTAIDSLPSIKVAVPAKAD